MSRKGADGQHLGEAGAEGQVSCADFEGAVVVLLLKQCAHCGGLFGVCAEHDRGQAYCSKACRMTARIAYLRQSRADYQRSPEGRLDQRDRMRARRRQLRTRVMEHGSEKLAQSEIVGAAEHARDAEVASVDLPAQRVDDKTSNVRDDCVGSEASSDLGAAPAAAGTPSNSEPQLSRLASPTPVARGLIGGAPRSHLCCVVCGRVGDRYLVRNPRGSGGRRGRSGASGARSGSGGRSIRR